MVLNLIRGQKKLILMSLFLHQLEKLDLVLARIRLRHYLLSHSLPPSACHRQKSKL